MGTNAIPRTQNFTDIDFGKWKDLESPKIYKAFEKGGVKEVLNTFFTDSEYVRKKDEPLEAALFRAAGRNALVVFEDIGRFMVGGVEAALGGVTAPIVGLIAMLDSLPEAAWIGIHAASNGAEAFKRLNKAVDDMRKEGKWTAHEALWAENKEAIQRNWDGIKDQRTWQLTAEALECFVTGIGRMALAAGSAPVNATQAIAQVAAGTGVAVGRPIGIAILEFLHLAKPLGQLLQWVGRGLEGVGNEAHQAAKELAKNTVWAEIPGLETKA